MKAMDPDLIMEKSCAAITHTATALAIYDHVAPPSRPPHSIVPTPRLHSLPALGRYPDVATLKRSLRLRIETDKQFVELVRHIDSKLHIV
jgi:hypothetical protein